MGTETKEASGIFWKIGLLVTTGMMIALDLAIEGLVLSYLWVWFFVPILNLPPLSLTQAIGIAVTVGFLTRHFSTAKDDEDEFKIFKKMLKATFIDPFLILAVGYIVHLMM
jgi:hypothetical protein